MLALWAHRAWRKLAAGLAWRGLSLRAAGLRVAWLAGVSMLAAGSMVLADGLATQLPRAPQGRLLNGFDGLRFGWSRRQVEDDLRRRDALQVDLVRLVAGDELRYRTFIGDLPFDVFLQFESSGQWSRAIVQLSGSTFGQTAQRCAQLHERVVYLVSLQYGPPEQRIGPSGRALPRYYTQNAEYQFLNAATVTVHNRFDADTCYNLVVYDATPRRPVPSTF